MYKCIMATVDNVFNSNQTDLNKYRSLNSLWYCATECFFQGEIDSTEYRNISQHITDYQLQLNI